MTCGMRFRFGPARKEHPSPRLVRQAVRERYLGKAEARQEAMTDFIGIWKDRADLRDPVSYIRRLERLRDK